MMKCNFNKGKNRLRIAYKRLSEKYENGSMIEDMIEDIEGFDVSHLAEYMGYQNMTVITQLIDDCKKDWFKSDSTIEDIQEFNLHLAEYMEYQNMTGITQIIDNCKKNYQDQGSTDRSFLIEQVINAVCNSKKIIVNDDVIEKIFNIFIEEIKETALEKLCLSEKIPCMDDKARDVSDQIVALAEAYKNCGFDFDNLPDIMLTNYSFITTYFEIKSSLEPTDDEKRMVEAVNSLCGKYIER